MTADDVAASLIGIFTVFPPPGHETKAARLLDLLMDGLRSHDRLGSREPQDLTS